jgi:uncharacterized glyoxalase superfamily protein PhnB/predicted N-acetyltransferase YhbS
MADEKPALKIHALSPILAVPDVPSAIEYYVRVFDFDRDWVYGDPPVHGAVRRGNIQIQFGQNAEMAARSGGMQFLVFVEQVDEFYVMHRARGAQFVSPIGDKPWGLREYTVRDPWGYQLRFAGSPKFKKPADARDSLPESIRILERQPTVEEYVAINRSVNWSCDPSQMQAAIDRSLYCVVAVDESNPVAPKTVGMLRIVGDGVTALYIQDVAVMPEYQNRQIGASLLETAMKWVSANAPRGAFLGLFTVKPEFYERFDFKTGGGMHLKV